MSATPRTTGPVGAWPAQERSVRVEIGRLVLHEPLPPGGADALAGPLAAALGRHLEADVARRAAAAVAGAVVGSEAGEVLRGEAGERVDMRGVAGLGAGSPASGIPTDALGAHPGSQEGGGDGGA
jgi:hypothetical protein